jgi:hypothetical protein
MYSSLKIVRKLGFAWMYYPNALLTGFAISKGYITYDDITGLVQIVEQGKTKRPEVLFTNITVVDEFTGGVETSFNTFAELLQYLVVLNNSLVVDIAGGDFYESVESNKFIIKPNFTILNNVITINPNGIWKIQNITYTNPVSVPLTIDLCQPGKTRLDYIVPNTSNGFTVIKGQEANSTPIAPQIPYDNLYVTFYLVSDTAIQNPSEPIPGELYVEKVETSDFTLNYSGQDSIVEVNLIDNRSSIIVNDGILEIQSFNVLPQYIRPGKSFYIKNNTTGVLKLKSQSGSGVIKFSRDIIIDPSYISHLKLNSNTMLLELVGRESAIFPKIQFIADGITYDFNLGTAVRTKAVFWNGVLLNDNDFSQSGTTLTLTFTPVSGDIIKPI